MSEETVAITDAKVDRALRRSMICGSRIAYRPTERPIHQSSPDVDHQSAIFNLQSATTPLLSPKKQFCESC
jgi:hypothetical protein